MYARRAWLAAAALAALALPAAAADTPGVTVSEIKIGQTMPYSGPASAYGTIGKAETAYFNMINEQGGINGRKLNLISLDDGYSPPKTVEQIRRLVEQEDVAFIFQSLGTPSNTAIQKYLNAKKVPQLFVATGASKWGDPEHFHWTIGWKPLHFMPNVSISVASVMTPAGPEKGVGIITASYGKDPTDPRWKDDAGMKQWRDFMAKYYPDGDQADASNVYGYGVAMTMVQVLKQCGNDLSRENVMKQAANLKNLDVPTLLPGIKINTSPTDYYPIQQMQLQKWDGKTWVLFGDVISGEGS